MKTVTSSRALALGVAAALAAATLPLTSASAAPAVPASIVAASQDGAFFQAADYADGDLTVQVRDSAGKSIDVDDAKDLDFQWTFESFGPGATPSALTPDVSDTDVNGKFVVPLPINEGPGTYTLQARVDDADGQGTTITIEPLAVKVGNVVPPNSVASIGGLGTSTPGLVQQGTLKVVDDNDDPVEGLIYSVDIDHGFFTAGEPKQGTTAGSIAGNLPSSGTRLSGITNAAGVIEFQTGIARDAGFDDDGIVKATVTASGRAAGAPAASRASTWNSGTEANPPLNGRVAIRVAPSSAQLNPVNPTLAGDSTVYDAFALDQFGNPVDDVNIEVDAESPRKSLDIDTGDVLSNFDNAGDFSVVSYVTDRVVVSGVWRGAPEYVYTDTNGNAAKVADEDLGDVSGDVTSSWYEINFNASRFSMSSSVSDTVRVGTTVTQTVRAVDQQGNPIEGFTVRFLRFGPDDATNGDVVATKPTNAFGEATYSFIGTRRGRALITAEITDANGNRRKELNGSAAFGAAVNARLARTKGKSSTGRVDRLTVSATKLAKGARVNLYKVVKGKQKLVGSKRLGKTGTASFSIRDRNGKRKTKYVAIVRSTSVSIADQSRAVNVR